jgi:hypothetical protein
LEQHLVYRTGELNRNPEVVHYTLNLECGSYAELFEEEHGSLTVYACYPRAYNRLLQ